MALPMTALGPTHPDYDLMATTWRKLRDTYAGRDALIRGRTLYLPQPPQMEDAQYGQYLNLSQWFGATKRTVQAFEGLAFRQPMAIQVPPRMAQQLTTITSTGVSLQGLAKLAFREVLLMGRYGILVDMGANGDRPYWAGYPTESILDWDEDVMNGQRGVSRVVLLETSWVRTASGAKAEHQQRRILELIDGVYVQTIEQLSDTGIVLGRGEVVNERQRTPLTFLPFVFLGTNDLEPSIELSALNDLVDKNLAYWRHSADYEGSLHLAANPTLVITGHDKNLDLKPDGSPDTDVLLGSNQGIILREPDAKIYFLEFQGQGLGPARQAMLDDKLEMASLGARLLEGQPTTDETLGAAQMRQTGDTSVLMALAGTLSAGLTQLLRYHAFWFGAASTPDDGKITCMLPTNFSTARLEPQLLTALMVAVQEGHLSQETFYYNLRQGEIAEPGIDFEVERARIEAQAPAMVRLLTTPETREVGT